MNPFRHTERLSMSRRPQFAAPCPRGQKGAVLILSLVFLVIMTILGVTGMRSATLEERMAGNLRDGRLAFEAAEAGLREGESLLRNSPLGEEDFDGSDGLFDYELAPALAWNDSDAFSDGNTRPYEGADELTEVEEAPRYFIERQRPITRPGSSLEVNQPIAGDEIFRITVEATGGSERAIVILQSTYIR